MLGDIQLALDECPVDDQFRSFVRKARPLASLDLFLHRLEVPLCAVHADCEDAHEAQVLGVFCRTGVNTPETMLPSWNGQRLADARASESRKSVQSRHEDDVGAPNPM